MGWAGVPWWAALGGLLGSCATGVGLELDEGSDASVTPILAGRAGEDAGASGMDSGPGAQDPREPCNMGQTRACTCPNGGEATVAACRFDANSPLDGYFEACMPCPDPMPPGDPCMDGAKNGAESDTDCGGPDCPPCGSGETCVADGDCVSGLCADSVCAVADAGATPGACPTGSMSASGECEFPFTVSNFDPSMLDPDAAGATTILDCAAEIDTSGTPSFTTWCGGSEPPIVVQAQDGGPEIAVVAMRELSMTGSLRVVGTRALVLAVLGDATVQAGAGIDAGAVGSTPGAGGSQCEAGMGQGGDSPSTSRNTGGGGGGGFGTAGGAGGTGDSGDEPAGEAGAVHATAELTPLLAGCRGGHTSECPSGGGGGGGALQLTAGGTLTVAGSISAGGGDATGGNCGAGGGSGGGILLEGADVDVSSASLSASGGRGEDASAGGPDGAPGSTGPTEPGADGSDGNSSDGGSGGGGGYGRIHVVARGGTCTGAGCS